MLRNFVFTVNNYTEDELAGILGRGEFTYVICGMEVGEEGTPHLQGYAELATKKRFETVRRLFGGRAHIESRRGTQEQAVNYCKKDGEFREAGEKRCQGYRADLDRVRGDAIDNGMRGVVREYNLQQIRVAEKFLEYNEDARDWKPTVRWYWGGTGVGKSRRCRTECDGMDMYVKNSGNKWWPGYDGHSHVIIDDFRDDWWSLEFMLALLDRYGFVVECKGGQRQFLATDIWITTPFSPEHCYAGRGDINQLLRRIDVVEQIVPDVPEVVG